MHTHPVLRAYMAGITFPTVMLLLLMSADAIHRASGGSTVTINGIEVMRLERALIFPMAFVPNLWVSGMPSTWPSTGACRRGRSACTARCSSHSSRSVA